MRSNPLPCGAMNDLGHRPSNHATGLSAASELGVGIPQAPHHVGHHVVFSSVIEIVTFRGGPVIRLFVEGLA